MIALSAHTAAAARRLVDEVLALGATSRTVLRLTPYAAPDELDAFRDLLAGVGRLENAVAHDGPEVADLIASLRAEPRVVRLAFVGAVLVGDRVVLDLPYIGDTFARSAELVAAVEADHTGWSPAVVIAGVSVGRAVQDSPPDAMRAIVRARLHRSQPEPLRPLWAAIGDAAGASTDVRRVLALEQLVGAARAMPAALRRDWARTVRSGELGAPPARALYVAVADLVEAVDAVAVP